MVFVLRPFSTARSLPIPGFQIRGLVCWLAVSLTLLLTSLVSGQIFANPGTQEEEPETIKNPVIERHYDQSELETMPLDQLSERYRGLLEELRGHIKNLKAEGARYYNSPSTESYEHQKKWREIVDESDQAFQKLKEVSLFLYLRTETPDESLAFVASIMNEHAYDDGWISMCKRVSDKLIKRFPEAEKIQLQHAKASALTNDFEPAIEFAKQNPAAIEELTDNERSLFYNLPDHQRRWKEELAIRQREAAADSPLPRVELDTSCGKIVIELFENQAPGTVGNFVNLVQSNFYDDMVFHPVVRNFMVRCGLLTARGERTTGYEIENESTRPDARHFFRGSVVMLASERTKGASEFAIFLTPNIFVESEAKDTVFGRVVEGMEVVEQLNTTSRFGEGGTMEVFEPFKPDFVKTAKAYQLRPDTQYKPKIVEK